MGLVVNTNCPALNATNTLNKNSKKLQKSMEKLASGYKINHSGDDASGLSISEKMRNQITALDTTIDSDEDAVNLVNTAEGYLAEIQNMVERMTELTVKSSNGVLQDNPDRLNLQREMNQLCGEIDRISSTANFNGIKVLNGVPTQKVEITRTVMVPEQIPYSNLIKNVNNLSTNQLINNNEVETVKFLSNIANDYVKAHNNDKKSLNNMAIFYNSDGTKSCVKPKDSDPADIKTALGMDPGDELKKAETNNWGIVTKYDVKIYKDDFCNGDSTGAATAQLIGDALEDFKQNNLDANGNPDLSKMVGKYVYYTKDGTHAIVADGGTDSISIKQQLTALGASQPIEFNGLKIKTAEESHPYYWTKVGQQVTETVEEPVPYSFKIGETSTQPDKIDFIFPDLHSDKLFEPEFETILTGSHTEEKTITTTPTEPFASVGGDRNSQDEDAYPGSAPATYTTIVTVNTYETVQINPTIDYNDASSYKNAITPDISTQNNAIKNIDYIKKITGKVSDVRGEFAAKQNRIEHTIKDLTVTSENMSAAKSRIKDTDMAKEMMTYTSENIIAQAAQSMLSQANAQPQNILSLLQQS